MTLKRMVLVGCGWGVVFGLLNSLSNIFLLPSAPFISIRPQIALPMIVGILVHPAAGFLTGFTGNIIGDGLSGFGIWTFWNWHLANGFMGFIPGLTRYLGIIRIRTVRDFGIIEMFVILAGAASVALAVLLDVLFLHVMKFPASFPSWILPAFLTDSIYGFILVPVALILCRRIIITLELRTILLITGFLVTAILSTAITITWSVWDDLVSTSAMIENFYVAGIVSVFLLIFGFIAAVGFVRRITDPLSRFRRAAEAVENGNYDLEMLDDISPRSDELGQLSRVLQGMAEKIRERETHLKKKIEELEIRIDHRRQAEEVKEIVETEYFQQLKKKAREFRSS